MKFKYMIRGLGLGVIITAAVMGAYSRNAVANARTAVLREYGIEEGSRLDVEENEYTENTSESLSEEASAIESSEPIIVRDEEKESEIRSVLDDAKESEQASQTETTEPSGDNAYETESFHDNATESSSSVSETVPTEIAATETFSDGQDAAGDVVEIVIMSGDDSGTVSRKLYNAGLIENASEYDAFLMQHGYDKKLSIGTKTIGVTDSWQEIAEKITTK